MDEAWRTATSETPKKWIVAQCHGLFVLSSIFYITRAEAETAAAKLADYDRLAAEVSRLNRDRILEHMRAALQKPEGEPQAEGDTK